MWRHFCKLFICVCVSVRYLVYAFLHYPGFFSINLYCCFWMLRGAPTAAVPGSCFLTESALKIGIFRVQLLTSGAPLSPNTCCVLVHVPTWWWSSQPCASGPCNKQKLEQISLRPGCLSICLWYKYSYRLPITKQTKRQTGPYSKADGRGHKG